jgi:hypothetical protein
MPLGTGARVDYTFLLVNYNMAGLVERCITMISESVASGTSYELLLADNSTDERFAIRGGCPELLLNVKLFRLPAFSFTQCLNYLVAKSSGRFVIMMHPDVSFPPDCLGLLAAFMEEHPKVGAVSPDLYYPTGLPNRIRLRLPSVTSEFRGLINTITYILAGRHFLSGEVLWDRSAPSVEADMLMSVFMLVRRQMLDDVGPFDESIRAYYSNDYLCARGRLSGWQYYYLRDARAIHFERYAPTGLFSDTDSMSYKTDPVPANPGMRADFIQFIRICYPAHKAICIRLAALAKDLIGLASQLRHYRSRRANVRSMWQSVRVLCGLRP